MVGTPRRGVLGFSTEAKLFAVNPVTGKKVWEGTPLPGHAAITSLAVAPNGHLWGVSTGTLFELNASTRRVLRTKELFSYEWANRGLLWSSARLEFGTDADMYGQVLGNLVRIHPATLKMTVLATDTAGTKPISARAPNGTLLCARHGAPRLHASQVGPTFRSGERV